MCVSANYRLSPDATFPDHLIDVKKVIAWVRAHGHEYGADPSVLFVAGSSAGGHLAAMAALTPGDPVFQPDFEEANTTVTAAISLCGYYGPLDTTQGPASSPLAYIRPDAPPFFVAQGDRDTYAPELVEGARQFVEQLRPGGQHSFDLFHSIRFDTVVDAIEDFAAWVRSTRVRSQEQATPASTDGTT